MKDKYFNLLLPISWVLMLLFCCFLFAFTSHAADISPNSLPVLIDSSNFVNADGYSLSDLQEFYNNRWSSVYPLDFSSIDNLIIYDTSEVIGGVTYNFTLLFCPNTNFNNTYSFTLSQPYNSFNTVTDSATLSITNYFYIQFSNYANEYNDPYLNPLYSYNITFFGSSKNEVKYINNALNFNADNTTPVFVNAIPVTPTGHATAPDNFEEPVFPTGHARPNQVPQLTINNYTWTTPPTPDLSTLENTAESIYNYLSWLGSNLIGAIGNIVTNIQNVGNFIADTLQYYLGLILDAIKNSINTFYNNMVSLFEPIATAISYITSPIDANVINAAFTSTDFYGVKSQFTSTFNTFDNAFDISEPDSFTLIFNVQNITLFYDFGVRSPVTVDLGANFIPIRQALRTFLWVLVSFGSVFVVEHGLANWLRGERNT